MMTSARELSSRLADLLHREHCALADFLVALSEFDRARGWVELGYASLFDYLHRALGLSKGAAFYRMTAARLVEEHPAVVEPLRDGRLCLTSVVALSKALTVGKVEDVLPRFFGLSTREAKAVTAELVPETRVPRRTVVTAVAAPEAALALELRRPAPEAPSATGLVNPSADLDQLVGQTNQLAAPATPRPSAPVLVEEPMTAELSRVHLTVPRRLMKKIDAARAALSHSHPRANEADVLEVGLDLILDRHAKRRGLVKKPRPAKTQPAPAPAAIVAPPPALACHDAASAPAPRNRAPIPASVKRAVWLRDGGRCQWKLDGGGICGSTLRVEIDHIVPVALGGESTVENCDLKCRMHNDLAARQVFGDEHMDLFTQREARPPA